MPRWPVDSGTEQLDPHYAGYFELFNRGKFFEAHDVLEHLWLPDRHGANGSFYKGLIQLAGAFVHLQRNRLRPAAALFKLARTNFANISVAARTIEPDGGAAIDRRLALSSGKRGFQDQSPVAR